MQSIMLFHRSTSFTGQYRADERRARPDAMLPIPFPPAGVHNGGTDPPRPKSPAGRMMPAVLAENAAAYGRDRRPLPPAPCQHPGFPDHRRRGLIPRGISPFEYGSFPVEWARLSCYCRKCFCVSSALSTCCVAASCARSASCVLSASSISRWQRLVCSTSPSPSHVRQGR